MPSQALVDLDGAVRAAQAAFWDAEAQRVRRKSVLLVEGVEDRVVFEGALSARRPAWAVRVAVVAMGGRRAVIDAIGRGTFDGDRRFELPPNTWAVVDRDAWSDDDVARLPEVIQATPGWCLENEAFGTEVLGEILRKTVRPGEVSDAWQHLEQELERLREPWVRAAAWWRVVQRHRESQAAWLDPIWDSFGAVDPRIDTSSAAALESSVLAAIGGAPNQGASLAELASEAAREADRALALPSGDHWTRHVHGKRAFSQVLGPLLNRVVGPRSASDWRRALSEATSRSPFISEVIARFVP